MEKWHFILNDPSVSFILQLRLLLFLRNWWIFSFIIVQCLIMENLMSIHDDFSRIHFLLISRSCIDFSIIINYCKSDFGQSHSSCPSHRKQFKFYQVKHNHRKSRFYNWIWYCKFSYQAYKITGWAYVMK